MRPGGVVAFITSKGTMDKQSPDVRKYIAQRAELLGAVRLPNNAFKANAGTEVTTDILFLQKRDRPIDIEPDWVHLSTTEDGIPINSYFADHPEMVLGKMAWDDSMYGSKQETACLPIKGAELADQLTEAMQHISGQITEAELPDLGEGESIDTSIPADPRVRNFSYTIVNGDVYYRENSRMVKPELNATAVERVKGLVALRDCVSELIEQQMDNAPDEIVQRTQARLNAQYDDFTAKYGLINNRGNANAFSSDSAYYLLCSLEILDENRDLARKADMFTRRTIRPAQAVEHVDTAAEALALSIAERARVDMPYMTRLSGKTEDELVSELQGVIFRVPAPVGTDGQPQYATADEYLSGNIREKLAKARYAAEVKLMADAGYSVKRGAHITFRSSVQKQNIRLRSLGAGYSEDELCAVIAGERPHTPYQKRTAVMPQKGSLLIDIEAKMRAGKGRGYQNWAKVFNLKQMAQTMAYLQEHHLLDYADLTQKVEDTSARFNALSASIRGTEKRMAEIAALKTHIINYSKTRDVYATYRKAGYSKKYLAEHESEIILHKAAKKAFDTLGLKKLPTVKSLNIEYAELLSTKKAAYGEYYAARDERKELLVHRANVDRILKNEKEKKREVER